MVRIGKDVGIRFAVVLGAGWFILSVFAVVHLAGPQPAPQSAYSACLAYVNGHGLTTDVCGPLSPTVTSPSVDDTSEFNAGFADSKQDDCQQGDAKACAWLRGN